MFRAALEEHPVSRGVVGAAVRAIIPGAGIYLGYRDIRTIGERVGGWLGDKAYDALNWLTGSE